MKKRVFAIVTAAAVAAMNMTVFAGDLSYQITSGDTGKTAVWTNPYSGQSMTIPVVTEDAKITLKGDSGQPIIDEYNTDGSLLINDGFMGDFSVYPTQEVDIADILNRLDSSRSSETYDWLVPFPENWVCYVGDSYSGSGAAFYVASNPDSISGSSSESAGGGWKEDSTGWWWQNADGSYPVNTWKWLDGDGDGAAECYYFDGSGYMLAGTATPDGYLVDENGAWVLNGAVQTQAAGVQQ